MERMTIYLDELEAEKIRLEEENKNLKEQLERMKTDTMYDMKDINSLYEENKKLNIKVASLEGEIKGLNSVIEKLKEEMSQSDERVNGAINTLREVPEK